MTVFFETKTSVFTDDARLVGDIEEHDGTGLQFTAAVEVPLSADELIQIGEYMKALNEKPRDKLIEDARYIIEAIKRGANVADYAREIDEWLDVNGVTK